MKKVLLSLAAVFAFGLANAQETENNGFAKGDVFLSGSVGFSSESTGDVKTNGFNITPSAGYFVSENIAVGLSLGYTSTKDEAPNREDIKYSEFGIGAFGRYYFTPANKFSLFGQLGVGYQNGKYEQGSTEVKSDGFNVAVAPGINYFVSEHFALEATFGILSYSTSKPDFDGAESTDNFDFGVNLDNINFGIVYKF
ncbi:porin family protein [Flavobacterium sp. C4GT6]|uniref:porin family protein n=1 Tax=Flavobacterium sp. C4GT6 TaxID=3103818 RepID=UPI002ED13F88